MTRCRRGYEGKRWCAGESGGRDWGTTTPYHNGQDEEEVEVAKVACYRLANKYSMCWALISLNFQWIDSVIIIIECCLLMRLSNFFYLYIKIFKLF